MDPINDNQPIQVETFNIFPVNELQTFTVTLAKNVRAKDLEISITNPILGLLELQFDWSDQSTESAAVHQQNGHHASSGQSPRDGPSRVRVSFRAPIVGIYTVNVELLNNQLVQQQQQQLQQNYCMQFQAKAYDLSRVFINGSSGKGRVDESYEFGVDASEAGEGQLEIAVNEGEIPNQVQVLDNGKCIVNFRPEEAVPHVVDIKFNGHNVNGCPFVVQVAGPRDDATVDSKPSNHQPNISVREEGVSDGHSQLVNGEPRLIKDDRILVNSRAVFVLENIRVEHLNGIQEDLLILDPENSPVNYKIIDDSSQGQIKFEFKPTVVGDYAVELKSNCRLIDLLPPIIVDEFPFSLKVFDHNKVIVSDVTDGVVGHPVYFFIDASQAGSGNLEIRVSSTTRNVPNLPQSEANAKIRVNFTPTEAVDHSIDVKFNGIPVPNNPFIVKISQFPRARLPITSQDLLKYVAVNETVTFYVDCLAPAAGGATAASSSKRGTTMTNDTCKVFVLKPDFTHTRLSSVELIPPSGSTSSAENGASNRNEHHRQQQARFKIAFKPTKIGPYKLFISVDNEILPGSPVLSNVYNINEVRVSFEQVLKSTGKPVGRVNEPVSFTVDASKAGEGTLALAVVSSLSRNPVQTDVKVSEKGHGLYNLTFTPAEFAAHSIDMSFNDRVVPHSPFRIEMLDAQGKPAPSQPAQIAQLTDDHQSTTMTNGKKSLKTNDNNHPTTDQTKGDLINEFKAMKLNKNPDYASAKSQSSSKSKAAAAPIKSTSASLSKEDELLQSIDVHGVSLKRAPVNSRGVFIIETNKTAQAADFDVLIADPGNSLVDVQCYLQQDGNLLAEWTPRRVGTHRIEVLYKNQPVPGSPFITEAFDPSGVIIQSLKTHIYSLEDLIEVRVNKREAGLASLGAVLTDPNGDDDDKSIEINQGGGGDQFDMISFKPSMTGQYKLSITLDGYEVPKSPLLFNVRDTREPVKLTGTGLRCAEVNRTAQFQVDSSGSDGELKLRIECGDREIVPKVERKGESYVIKYKPTEIGYATISLYWNGKHLDRSPYSVPVVDLTQFVFSTSSAANSGSKTAGSQQVKNQIMLDYEPRVPRDIFVNTSKCGSGELKAEAYCRANPNIKFPVPVSKLAVGRHKLIFVCPPPLEESINDASKEFPLEATYMIRFYYNNLSVPETLASVSLSPIARSQSKSTGPNSGPIAAVGLMTTETNNNNSKPSRVNAVAATAASLETSRRSDSLQSAACPTVALRGHGLVEAKCGERAEFTIDGRGAGPGKPEVRFHCAGDEIKVKLEQLEDKFFEATYIAQSPGAYSLNVLWDGQQVAGCPIVVNIISDCDPTKVICTADSLKGGVLGEEVMTFIDTRRAGPGELTALCTGPKKVAFCELIDRDDGTFTLYITPQESGRHLLTISYGGQHIPKSPFSFKVSGRPDPSRVRVYGPGVEHGVLSLYQSRFVCDTRGAGAGQLTVRIRGPKGAFRMETQRESQRDRTILCKYDPTEPGDYRIEIKWSDRHVPGSPFSVMIFDTQEELNRFLLSQQQQVPSTGLAGHANKAAALNSTPHHQVPFQPTLVEYGQYPNGSQPPKVKQTQYR